MKEKHSALDARYFDEAEGRRQKKHPRIKFRPRRRQLAFPLRQDKALILITGRPTIHKALKAYRAYCVAWRHTQHPKYWDRAEEDVERALADPWFEKDFLFHLDKFWRVPRRNFRPSAKGIEKILQNISRAGIKLPSLENWTPLYSSDGKRVQ
jgi:hypothetical protein